MRKLSIILIILLLSLLTGCFNDPVKDDLTNYIRELQKIVHIEDEVIREYESVTGKNYTDDYTTFIHINDVVLPKYMDFVDRLESITPETDEVREIHESYIRAANMQQQAMIMILDALYYQDLALVAEANEKLSNARSEIRYVISDLKKLANKHGIKLK